MAGIAYVATQGQEPTEREVTTRRRRPVGRRRRPTPSMPTTKPKPDQAARSTSGKVYVEVYNNSGITGLAGRVAATGHPGRLAGRRLRQLVRHHPRLHRLLPAAAQGRAARAAGPRPRHPPRSPRDRPDEARPAHGHPHRRPRLTHCLRPRRSARPWLGWAHGVHLRRGRASGTPRWSRAAADVVVGLDFDGTLSPIVDDPESAHIHPDAREVLIDLADAVARGRRDHRPARPPGARARRPRRGRRRDRRRPARELYLFGQYGNERWSSTNRRVISPAPAARAWRPSSASCPRVLRRADAADALRRGEGAGGRRAHPPPRRPRRRVRPAASSRSASSPSGTACASSPAAACSRSARPACTRAWSSSTWSKSSRPAASCSPATTSATSRPSRRSLDLRGRGLPTLLVCSASDEESALADLADVVVDGPDGVLDLASYSDAHRGIAATASIA